MGRLFWKIFFAFWLAQLAAGIGTGTVVWLRHQTLEESETFGPPQRHDPFFQAAQTVLKHGGVESLRALLKERTREPAPPIYALDAAGNELLGRAVPDSLRDEQPDSQANAKIQGEDGQTYRLFMTHDGPPFGDRPPPPLPPPDGFPPIEPPGPPPLRRPPSPIILVIAGLLASLLFSVWLAWYLSRPIRHLRMAFDGLADGKLDTRVGPVMGKRRDELSDLGRNFDYMAGRIGALVEAQRRLLHDVSHELRSPLARLQVAIGLLRQQPDKASVTVERIERESERLDHLVGELLTLSRLEAGVPVNRVESIDVAGLLADIVEDARFEAETKGVRVECDFSEDAIIQGQTELIHRAIENIVRNAIRHTPAEASVTLSGSFDRPQNQLRLSVCDQGSGVPEEQLTIIFEPFFQGGNRPTKGGAGLGLAIARRAVQAHGGTIQASNRREGGLCVEMVLPASAPKV